MKSALALLHSDSVLTDRARLAIMVTLATAKEPMSFNILLETLNFSKGNLSSHIRKLEDSGCVRVSKTFVERKPKTTYECTPEGRKTLDDYLKRMEDILKNLSTTGDR